MPENFLPDVFFIGLPKTGTTTIHQFLSDHPEVIVDRRAGSFVYESVPSPVSVEIAQHLRNAKVYVSQEEKLALSLVAKQGRYPYKGFLYDPDVDKNIVDEWLDFSPLFVANQIKSKCPNAKILICLREQSEWLVSAFSYLISNLPKKKRFFVDFLRTPRGRFMQKLGYFDEFVKIYFEVFGRNRVKVLRLEELKVHPESFYREICTFIGVEYIPPRVKRLNVGRTAAQTYAYQLGIETLKMPYFIKRWGYNCLKILPKKKFEVVSAEEIKRIKTEFETSNIRLKEILDG